MFTTFPVPSTASSRPNPNPNPNTSSASPIATQPPRPRQKRSQVTRACDWCRTHRIKCDTNYPCLNCHARGGQCSNDRTNEIRTLPHAFREIERLRQRHKELQEELEEERSRNRSQTEPLVVSSGSRLLHPSAHLGLSQPPTAGPSNPVDGGGSPQKYWEGVYIRTAKSSTKTWYGPSSLLYFISRLTVFLALKLQQYQPEYCTQPNSVPKPVDEPSKSDNPADEGNRAPPDDTVEAREYLTPTQEEYFLDFYWQSYHTSLLVLNEDDFKQHYKSLWAGSRRNRKPSALVDIVIALCMQYGMARSRSNSPSLKTADINAASDAALAGRWYYCRCQTLLAYELESPTISTLQCNILSVIWLCCASLQNIADNTLALTARTAQRLGLHLPSPNDVSLRENELRKSLWWSIYVLETKISMKLGRPFLLHPSRISCGLPGDGHEAVNLSGSNFAPLGDHVTWLSWNLHNTKLVLAARNIYTAFYDKYPDIFNGDDDQTIYDTPTALETYANFLITQMKALESWVKDVPDALRIKRQNHGIPFSTDLSPLEIEQFAPLWVQHQRLLLELLYHNLCTNLYRPFISLKSTSLSAPPALSSNPSSSVESCACSCAGHAMAATYIMQQILSTTDILTGWHEAFQWQWNCAMTLVGFVIAYPNGELTRTVRESIRASLEVLESFGHSFAIAASAASIVRGMDEALDHTVVSMKPGNKIRLRDESMSIIPRDEQTEHAGSIGPEEESVTDMRDILAASREMAFAVDGYNSSNMWWPGMGPSEV